MGMLMTLNYYSNAKSIKELKMSFKPVNDSTKDAVNYFLSLERDTKHPNYKET